jgi:hypothetical protein
MFESLLNVVSILLMVQHRGWQILRCMDDLQGTDLLYLGSRVL